MNGSTPVTSLTVPGEGTYVVNTTTGDITFTPVPTFTGATTPVTYRVTDGNGATATATITVSTNPPPVANNDTASTPYETPLSLDPLSNDTAGPSGSPLDPTSVRLLDGSTAVTSLTIAGQGTYVVDPATGIITFTPVSGYIGTATPVTYRVADGNAAVSTATVTITVIAPPPATTNDTTTTQQGVPVVIDPLSNDTPGADGSPLDPTSVRLMDGTTPVMSLTIVGEGTYVVDPTTGQITFTPVPTFTGTSTPVTYRVTDGDGASSTAVITLTINGSPVATNDTASTVQGAPVTITVLANDHAGPSGAALDPTSVRIMDGGTPVTTLTVPNEGTYLVDATTGRVTFTPLATFAGTATPVTYRVADTNGSTVTATIIVTVTLQPAAAPDKSSVEPAKPVTVSVLSNDSHVDPSTLELIDPSTNQPAKTVTVAGVGTWTVNADGTVTFVSEPSFRGSAVISYQVVGGNGNTVTSTLTIVVDGLAFTGFDSLNAIELAMLCLIAGIALQVLTGRRYTGRHAYRI